MRLLFCFLFCFLTGNEDMHLKNFSPWLRYGDAIEERSWAYFLISISCSFAAEHYWGEAADTQICILSNE